MASAVALVLLAAAGPATAREYAPLERPGPPLEVPRAKLDAALYCHGNLAQGPRPVLLNPATGVTPDQNYRWNWERSFTAQGRPWCAVTMPHRTMGDIQTAGEYLVHAIRTMHRRAHRRISIVGHSQGGMSTRWDCASGPTPGGWWTT